MKSNSSKRHRLYSLAAAIGVLIIGSLVIAGWYLHNDVLRSLVPGAVKMKFNTAVCFVLAAAVVFTVPHCAGNQGSPGQFGLYCPP